MSFILFSFNLHWAASFSPSFAHPSPSPLLTFTTGLFILYLHLPSFSSPKPPLCIHSASYSVYPCTWLLSLLVHFLVPPDSPLNSESSYTQQFFLSSVEKEVAGLKCKKLNIQCKGRYWLFYWENKGYVTIIIQEIDVKH